MAALDSLRAEHALILEVVESLEERTHASVDGRLPHEYVRAMLDFMRIYVDTNHHGKEERVLFAHMDGDPFLKSVSNVLIEDHREGRRLVDAIERALVEGRPVAREVETYAAFIRVHIHRENDMIFDVAESELDARTTSAMQSEFLAIESEVLGIGGADRLLAPLQAAGV
ncbi:MAG TPA: hemerythrin domain-containing protein [Candidatus Dormibacteraeota bacterium]|nr:hemerythrin domain-containing protein [Candidatus Dormibacteraeota bacterium]